MTSLTKPKAFYDFLRGNPMLGPVLSASEVDGLSTSLAAMGAANWPIAFASYGLATEYHETATTMQPIQEYGGPSYFFRMYDPNGARPALAKRNGNIYPGDGVLFPGRGKAQITWGNNYRKLGKRLGIDLEGKPDLALVPAIAARILVVGMQEGLFSGPKLADTLPKSGPAGVREFIRSRPIINGTDDAAQIAGYALQFQTGLTLGGWK